MWNLLLIQVYDTLNVVNPVHLVSELFKLNGNYMYRLFQRPAILHSAYRVYLLISYYSQTKEGFCP
jgi:hypothetical protein